MTKKTKIKEEKEKSSQTLLEEIQNRPAFSYDPTSDPLYLHYAEELQKSGKKAMEDTLGKVSSLTGGYASSYAQTEASNAYQNRLSELNDLLPALEERAYERYKEQEKTLFDAYDRKVKQEQFDREFALESAPSAMDLTNENFYGWKEDDFVEYVIDLNQKYGSELTEAKIEKMQKDSIISEVTADMLLGEVRYGNANDGGKLSTFNARDWTLYAMERASVDGYSNLKKELDYYVERGWLSRSWQTKILAIVKEA